MLNIFVLEDNPIQQVRVKETILSSLEDQAIAIAGFQLYDNAETLLAAITEQGANQLFFLDIQIGEEDKKGLELAQRIRQKDPEAVIVFITTRTEFLTVTFKYKIAALDFIDKSVGDQEFYDHITSAIQIAQKNLKLTDAQDIFRYETDETSLTLPFQQILFFEVSEAPQKIILHTKDGRTEFNGRLSDIESHDPRLFRCHKRVVVNPENITDLRKDDRTAHFASQETCPVSRFKYRKLSARMGAS